MANTPKYVRLADHLSRGIRADIRSGWSIAGLDVREMPDPDTQPRSFEYVQSELNAGRLEGCSKAEYDEAHENDNLLEDLGVEVVRKVELNGMPNESAIQAEALAAHAARRSGRAEDSSDAAYEADEKRRKATIKAQKKADKGQDASDEQADAEAARAEAEAAAAEAAANKQS